MRTPLYRYTFRNKRIRKWVESHVEGKVLNLFAGKYRLNCDEVRNDIREDMDADYHMDALDFVKYWSCVVNAYEGEKFNTIILDPPYSLRKCMTKYEGSISSRFNQIKNEIVNILKPNGLVLTCGYHSNSMGKIRGFKQEHILLLSHGGSIHDTIFTLERKDDGLTEKEIGVFF